MERFRRALGLFSALLLLWTVPVQAQSLAAGLSGGVTQLGGLQAILGVDTTYAFSGTLFLDFNLESHVNVRLGANFATVEQITFSSFETNLFWDFPFGRARGIAGGGVGMFGIPASISPSIHLSFQGFAGIESDFLKIFVTKVVFQFMRVLRVNDGFFPGKPLFRLEVGLALPFRS